MATQTQKPPSAELVPLSVSEVPAVVEAPKSTEVAVPQSAEVALFEAKNELEMSSIAPAGYEIAIRPASELEVPSGGELVLLRDGLLATRETAEEVFTSVEDEEPELVEEFLAEHDIEAVPRRDLTKTAEAALPEHDSFLYLEGYESKPIAVKVGTKTIEMGVLDLYQYLLTVRETVPDLSVVDAKGDVLMKASGEIADFILNQVRIMKMARRAVGLAVGGGDAQVEAYNSGHVVVPQEISVPAEVSLEEDPASLLNDSTPSISVAPAVDPQAEESFDTPASLEPGAEMEMYDPVQAEANAGTSTGESIVEASTESESTQQRAAETGPAAIESAESQLASRAFDEVLAQAIQGEDWEPTRAKVEGLAGTTRKKLAGRSLGDERVHDSIDSERAKKVYDAIDQRIEDFLKDNIK